APGAVAEWLGSGLQSRLHRFESGRRLNGNRPGRPRGGAPAGSEQRAYETVCGGALGLRRRRMPAAMPPARSAAPTIAPAPIPKSPQLNGVEGVTGDDATGRRFMASPRIA